MISDFHGANNPKTLEIKIAIIGIIFPIKGKIKT